MGIAARRPCRHPGCGALVASADSLCDRHRTQRRAEHDQRRGSASARGYGADWRRARLDYLRRHPLCECKDCKAGELRHTPAVLVDHIVPHRGDMALFWDQGNWQAMSKACHDRKTAAEDGGFGNARRRTD